MPLTENVVSEAEKVAMMKQLQRALQPLPSKADFVLVLSKLLQGTEKGIERCELSEDHKKVVIVFHSGTMLWVKVEGDNNFALALDVLTALDNS